MYNNTVKSTQSSLRVAGELRREDSGVYTCHARNAYGEAVSSATIKVIGEYRESFVLFKKN